jgi:hypothetical protein
MPSKINIGTNFLSKKDINSRKRLLERHNRVMNRDTPRFQKSTKNFIAAGAVTNPIPAARRAEIAEMVRLNE